MYEVIFDEEAIEFLCKSSKELRVRIFSKIRDTKIDPHHFFKKLKGRKDYKLRVGDYRVIADIGDSSEKIIITVIGHRRNIYKKI